MKLFITLHIALLSISLGCLSNTRSTDYRKEHLPLNADTAQVYGMQATFNFARVEKDSLLLSFHAVLPATVAILPNEALTFTPVIVQNGHSVVLPPIVINGYRQKTYYKRELVLDYMQQAPQPYTVVNSSVPSKTKHSANAITINYLHRLPFTSWMGNASLQLIATGRNFRKSYPSDSVTLCANLRQQTPLLTDTVYLYRYDTLRLREVVQHHDTIQHIEAQKPTPAIPLTFRLWFRQGEKEVVPTLYGNAEQTEQMRHALSVLGSRLKGIKVVSCSSPEGTYIKNENLVKERGRVVMRHLLEALPILSTDIIELTEYPENWEGLELLLEKSDKPYRNSALDIIRNVPIFSSRETRLMELLQGEPYRDMFAEYFPLLRYANITLVCEDEQQEEKQEQKEKNEVEPMQDSQP